MEPNSGKTDDEDIINALYQFTKALSVALGCRDLMTRLHSERVRDLAVSLGVGYGLDADEISSLKLASSFHDIGKIGIQDHVLLKPGMHTADEWEIMKQHPVIGEKILLSTEFEGFRKAAIIVRHHHEFYNGKGYPDGLSGDAIPICSQFIAMADSYDAMAVIRAYHKPRTHREILNIMRLESGTKFNPKLMAFFTETIEQNPYRVA